MPKVPCRGTRQNEAKVQNRRFWQRADIAPLQKLIFFKKSSKIINSPQNNTYNFCRDNAPRPSTLAWRIPWTEEPGGLQSMGSLRVGDD